MCETMETSSATKEACNKLETVATTCTTPHKNPESALITSPTPPQVDTPPRKASGKLIVAPTSATPHENSTSSFISRPQVDAPPRDAFCTPITTKPCLSPSPPPAPRRTRGSFDKTSRARARYNHYEFPAHRPISTSSRAAAHPRLQAFRQELKARQTANLQNSAAMPNQPNEGRRRIPVTNSTESMMGKEFPGLMKELRDNDIFS